MAENTRQRRAFDLYWELGPDRSIEKLRGALLAAGKAPHVRTLYEWSSRYHWQDRLADLEREARRAAGIARLQAIEAMYERQTQEALLLQQMGAEWLTSMDAETVSPETAIRAIVEGAKLERQARGEPGERIEQEGVMLHGEIDLKAFSLEELRRLAEAAEGGVRGAGPA